MTFFAVILKNVLRRPVRSLLTASGIALAVATAVSLVSFSRGLETSASEVYDGHGIDLVVVRAGVAERLTSSLEAGLAKVLAELPGVADVNPSLTDMVSFGEGSMVGVPVHGWPLDNFALQDLRVSSGRKPHAGELRAVLVGEALVKTLEKQLGDKLEIEGEEFEIVGIFAGANTFENATAVVSLADLQELMDRPGQVTEFQVKLQPGLADRKEALGELCRKIADLRNGTDKRWGLAAIPTQEYINSSTEIRLARVMAGVTSIVALVIGSTAMLNTMIMSVLERTQEIGVLRAIGWRRRRVMRMVLGESLLLSLAGGLLGLALAWLLVSALSETSYVKGLLRADLSAVVIVEGLLVTLAVGLVGGAYPAYRGASLLPAEALHYE